MLTISWDFSIFSLFAVVSSNRENQKLSCSSDQVRDWGFEWETFSSTVAATSADRGLPGLYGNQVICDRDGGEAGQASGPASPCVPTVLTGRRYSSILGAILTLSSLPTLTTTRKSPGNTIRSSSKFAQPSI